jgi:hypothetical protein
MLMWDSNEVRVCAANNANSSMTTEQFACPQAACVDNDDVCFARLIRNPEKGEGA